jgi:hypothetical protein
VIPVEWDGRRCQRVWPSKHGGVNLCTLRHGHDSTRCLDTVANVSHPTVDTDPSAWDRVVARLSHPSNGLTRLT